MRFLMAFISNLVIAGCLECSCLALQTGQNITDSIAISIAGSDHPIPASSPVPVDVTITNMSNHDLYFANVPGVELSYGINVYDSVGKPLARRPISDEQQHVPFKRRTIVLKPGQQWKQEIFLGGLYDFSEPGVYTVQMNGVGQTSVISNIIQIDIVAAPSDAAPQEGSQAFDLGIVGPATLKVGSPLKVRIGLRNVLTHEIVIQQEKDGKAEFDYSVEVTDSKGSPTPKTQYGQSLSERKASMPSTAWKDVHLQPEQVLTDAIVITDIFDLSQPGEYLVSVSRRDEVSSWNRISSHSRLVQIVP